MTFTFSAPSLNQKWAASLLATLPRGERGGQSGKQNLPGLGAGAGSAATEPRPG